jgi:hypothetical protein
MSGAGVTGGRWAITRILYQATTIIDSQGDRLLVVKTFHECDDLLMLLPL